MYSKCVITIEDVKFPDKVISQVELVWEKPITLEQKAEIEAQWMQLGYLKKIIPGMISSGECTMKFIPEEKV